MVLASEDDRCPVIQVGVKIFDVHMIFHFLSVLYFYRFLVSFIAWFIKGMMETA